MRRALGVSGLLLLSSGLAEPTVAQEKVETALVVAVDVSGSVDETRYRLQMEGLAEALQDPGVVAAITAGGSGGIVLTLVAWADRPKVLLDWTRISSQQDAAAAAALIRHLPWQSGNFTCLGRMLKTLTDVMLPTMPVAATRVVIDVSGDGIDNCAEPDLMREDRDGVLATGATINGLPIIVPGENDTVNVGAFRSPGYGFPVMSPDPGQQQTTLDRWYHDHVVGGPGAFVMVAKGYGDFTRALRRKFVIEISDARGVPLPPESSRPKRS